MFGKKKTDIPEPEAVTAEPAGTMIGEGIIMVGDFEGDDPVVVSGTIRGSVKSTATVTINEGGLIKGSGSVENFKIAGKIDGTFECGNTASFTKTGIMSGTLTTNQLNTEPGTTFCGTLNLTLSREIEEKKHEAKEADEEQA